MKTYCETFNHWLYHPVDSSLLCEKRARRLPECRRCKGIEAPKATVTPKKEAILKMIALDVNKNKWIKAVKRIQQEYGISEGHKQDETSARRIAILLGELYLSEFRASSSKAIFNVPIVEKDAFDLAVEYRLTCDPLEHEERSKPHMRKQALCTWGVDKTSGVEGFTTQLKEWTAAALLEISETVDKEDYHGAVDRQGSFDFGSRPLEDAGFEEIGIG